MTYDDARARFAATAATYDRARRQLIPCFDRFYGTAVAAIEPAVASASAPPRVLDLGAGTGLLTAMVAEAHPAAALVAVDHTPAMLDQARARLADHPAATVLAGDLHEPLPDGPFDAVVSALAIHHLADDAKRDLFGRVHDVLRPGGRFVNADQVLAATPTLDAAQTGQWRAAVRAAGVTDDDLAAADARMATDICAPVEPQLAWLRDAGFVDVDAPFRDSRFAVFVATRPIS